MGRTILVLGDQLNPANGALADADPSRDRIVMIEVLDKLAQRPWHRQKLQLVLGAMRRFRDELRDAGFTVAYRTADSLRDGLADEAIDDVVAMAPSSYDLRATFERWGLETVPNDAFIVGEERFAAWADRRTSVGLEAFYRMVRHGEGWLMDGDEPAGGRWNHDHDNREKPPRDGVDPPRPYIPREDDIDDAVRRDLRAWEDDGRIQLWGDDGPRLFPATRAEAQRSLRSFLDRRLDGFGPLEDAVIADEPFLWHSLLSAPLNLGLIHPRDVCDAVDARWREHGGPINSVEGFLRQVCGWREYVWGLYWWRMPGWREENALGYDGDVPEAFWTGETDMACVAGTVADLKARAWTHHIPRLMILGGHALTAGTDPHALTDWFHATYADAYEWVMVPNVVGMSQWADGGVMATKPYASGGAYINRMTTYCGGCRFDPKQRTGDDACPFNSLWWDFLSRHRSTLSSNQRIGMAYGTLDRFDEAERRAIRARARTFRTDV